MVRQMSLIVILFYIFPILLMSPHFTTHPTNSNPMTCAIHQMESTPILQVQPSEHNALQPTSRKHHQVNVRKYRQRLQVAM